MSELEDLRNRLRAAAPRLYAAVVERLAPQLIPKPPTRALLGKSKEINDTIWKFVELRPLHVALLDLPLFQRLRRVRQLGLAYLVYPGANHTRFEHSIGALHVARRMYERLSAQPSDLSQRTDSTSRNFLTTLELAALFHDCGHPAFSHAGEKTLSKFYGVHFAEIKTILDGRLPDAPVLAATPNAPRLQTKRKHLPAAELVSILFVLSPALEDFLRSHGGSELPIEDQILNIAALIMGAPRGLQVVNKSDSRVDYRFIQNIISGDIDIDKIDYVARDAYYCGIPIAADVDRLLSQLRVASVQEDTDFRSERKSKLEFGGSHPIRYEFTGIMPSGISALEMFVFTRVYLFDRIYGHQKIRAAEKLLQKLLLAHIKALDPAGTSPSAVFDSLYGPTGDDGLLNGLVSGTRTQSSFSVDPILFRRLPERSFAVTRGMLNTSNLVSSSDRTQDKNWLSAIEELDQNPDKLENYIRRALSFDEQEPILVDWTPHRPIKEQLDVWVSDRSNPRIVLPVRREYDIGQHSNSYQNVREVYWVFGPPQHKAAVAAATALGLYELFDVLVDRESIHRAKLTNSEFETALNRMRSTDIERSVRIDNILSTDILAIPISPRASVILDYLRPLFEPDDSLSAATRLSLQMTNAKLPRYFESHWTTALEVFSILIRHCVTYNKNESFRDSVAPKNENRFKYHLDNFLKTDTEAQRYFSLSSGTSLSGGISDLLFTNRTGSLRVVVELKSEERTFEEQYKQHFEQPINYSADGCGRVSILYCQYKIKTSIPITDTFQIKVRGVGSIPQAVICLSQEAFWQPPSKA